MKKLLLGVLVGFVVLGLAIVIVFFAVVRAVSHPPSISKNSILVYRIEGALPESPQVEIPLPLFKNASPPTVRDHWELLRKAAADSRIRAVVFVPENVTAGWGKLEEIREDVKAFKKSGKPIYAALRAPGAREYYMAAEADRVYMAPQDYLNLKGLRAELTYFKKTLDKLGIQVEVEHVGKYKDAGDMFTRSSMSPETREVMNSILDGLYGRLVDRLAEARRKTPDQMRAIIDDGPFLTTQARDAGLVDGIEYQDQVVGELKQRLHLSEAHLVSTSDYMQVPPQSVGVETGPRIALVVAEGDIIRSGSDSLLGADGFVSSGGMTRLLNQVGSDPAIKGVIVRIDSPGGDGFASDEILRRVSLLAKKKPLVFSMSDLAASGGYYMAMTGNPIVAYPGTLTGSIGVLYGKVDLHGLFDKLGIQKDIMSRGRFANIDSDYTPLSDAERKKLQDGLEAFYKDFVSHVAQARKRTYGQIEPIAQGRVWLGEQALGIGLIDRLGGLDQAIDLIKQQAHIPREQKVRLVPYPPRRTILEQLLSRPEGAMPSSGTLAFLRRFSTRTWMKGGILRQMPYTIEVK
jgi:protease-4